MDKMIQFASLERRRGKKNSMFPSDPCCGELSWKHSGIVNADGLSWGVLVCQPVSLCLLIIRDTQITDSLHHRAMTHAHLFFSFSVWKKGNSQMGSRARTGRAVQASKYFQLSRTLSVREWHICRDLTDLCRVVQPFFPSGYLCAGRPL